MLCCNGYLLAFADSLATQLHSPPRISHLPLKRGMILVARHLLAMSAMNIAQSRYLRFLSKSSIEVLASLWIEKQNTLPANIVPIESLPYNNIKTVSSLTIVSMGLPCVECNVVP